MLVAPTVFNVIKSNKIPNTKAIIKTKLFLYKDIIANNTNNTSGRVVNADSSTKAMVNKMTERVFT